MGLTIQTPAPPFGIPPIPPERRPNAFHFDQARADRVTRFFERILKHPREKNRPFLLIPWQKAFLDEVFGWVDVEGLRQYQEVYLEIAKKNGKSELAAGIALYMLAADGEGACEVYSAATVKKQAAIVFNTAAAMVLASPVLRSMFKVLRSTKTIVKRSDPTSFYKVLAADGDAEDGINPHAVIIDELHRWKTGKALELYDVLTKGTIARSQPLVIEITTAGSTEDESPLCFREHERAENVRKGIYEDPRFLGIVFSAETGDDWTKVSTWEKANPSLKTLGGFLKLDALEKEFQKAINQPSRAAAFKRFHLGLWLSTETEWMSLDIWDRNAGARHSLIERACYAGLDLSSTTDLTSLVLLFPSGDGSFDVLPFFWMARERVRERELADRVPYQTWADQGFLELADGNVIDQSVVKQKLAWAAEVFNLQALAFDPHSAQQLSLDIDREIGGFPCIPVPQRFTHLSEPMKKVMEWALQSKLRHEGNPILRWNARCVRAKSDGNDNIRPVKPDRSISSKRIDGMVALILAASRAMFYEPSVYETRGIVSS
jgi:phage terminase large subunit-like protein